MYSATNFNKGQPLNTSTSNKSNACLFIMGGMNSSNFKIFKEI